eukprot:2122485-Alexandrium_andersonii.AAC.1
MAPEVDPAGLAGWALAVLSQQWRAEHHQIAALLAAGVVPSNTPGIAALAGPLTFPPLPGGSLRIEPPPA